MEREGEKYKLIFENANDSIIFYDLDGRILDCNKVACKRLGYSKEELKKMTIMDIDTEKAAKLAPKRIKEIQKKGFLRFEAEHKTKDGKIIPVDVSSKLIEVEGRKVILTIGRDITKRKIVEREIENLNKRLFRISEISTKITSTLALKKVLEMICEFVVSEMELRMAWIGLLDEKSKEVKPVAYHGFVGDYLKDIKITCNDSPTGMGPTGMAVKTGKSQIQNYIETDPRYKPWRKKALKHGYKSSAAIPLIFKERILGALNVYSGKKEGFKTSDVRILEIFASQAATAIENARLFENMQREKTMVEFLNDLLGHDVNNINQVTMGYLQLLEKTPLSKKQKKYVNLALESVERSARLVENIKKLQNIRERKVEKIDLNKVLKSSIEFVKKNTQKNVDVKTSISKNNFVLANKLLEDVFVNVLENAIKFTFRDNVRIDVKVRETKDQYKVEIVDRGIGIPPELRNVIFSRFERIEKDVRGFGLGLYLAKKILESFGGKIRVEERVKGEHEKGSRFLISLPKA